MLDIKTFDARRGGNVLYKALVHPLAAEAIAALAAELKSAGNLAVFDPDGVASALFALHPDMPRPSEVYVQDVEALGTTTAGTQARPLTDLPNSGAQALLIASFDGGRVAQRIKAFCPPGITIVSLDRARLPEQMLTNQKTYLDPLNFATNYAFFRESAGLSSRLTSANYWSGYGAKNLRLWLRLFDGSGTPVATWEQTLAPNAGGYSIDSREIRTRFNLPEFAGQLFIHAIGAAGHDVVKYALDVIGHDGEPSLSVTHDANAWPSDRYAGLPAPREDERVTLWVQNSHAAPVPPGGITLDRMGAEAPVPLDQEIPPFASVPVDVGSLLPGIYWPAQIELRSGRHVVRPRYEVHREGRTRIAHMNVERADLKPDPGIKSLSNLLGRGYLLPFPILDPARYRTILQPTPMAERQTNLPLRLDIFNEAGQLAAQRFLGNLPRNHDLAIDLDDIAHEPGHGELVYDFRNGGDADGWMHGLFRYEDRSSGHTTETSFGAHIFNTAMTYRDEPQSYSGAPPGLTTRLFLKLGDETNESFTVLIYPASAAWHPNSTTELQLIDSNGQTIDTKHLTIACSGSAMIKPQAIFSKHLLEAAGPNAYVLIRDTTCRLFGYHGLTNQQGGISLDHMFGF